jgi:hypothetical protein
MEVDGEDEPTDGKLFLFTKLILDSLQSSNLSRSFIHSLLQQPVTQIGAYLGFFSQNQALVQCLEENSLF